VMEGLISAVIGQEEEYNLDQLPVHQRALTVHFGGAFIGPSKDRSDRGDRGGESIREQKNEKK
ncbi:hypothetical protein AMECASPLE_030919, partial [Ameca splendens]